MTLLSNRAIAPAPSKVTPAHRAVGDAARAPMTSGVRWIAVAYGVLGTSLLGYLTTVLVRPTGAYSSALDGWLVDGIEIAAIALCFARVSFVRSGSSIAIAIGIALAFWCAGDIALTVESFGGATPPSPSLADLFYLGFYPFAYLAVVLFVRSELRRVVSLSWLDGAIAGVGAAAFCAAFLFHRILAEAGTSTFATVTNLSYPIGDLLLLALVIATTSLLPKGRRATWALVALGLGIVVLGDTANLLHGSFGISRTGAVLNAVAWPAASLLLSASVWVRAPKRRLGRSEPSTSFLVAGIGACSAFAIIVTASGHQMAHVAIALATATLVLVGIRFSISIRRLRALSTSHRHQSLTDDLTGLANRRYLLGLLEDLLAGRAEMGAAEGRLAFLFVDLDHFKEINDSFGHPAGDELLRQLGPRFRSTLRSSDVLVRLGGDEFVVLLLGGDVAYATDVARRLTMSLDEPFALDAVSARVSASIGIAMAPGDADDAVGLMWCADVAMYRAKLGGAPFAVYGQELDGRSRLQLAEELRDAIDSNQLVVHFQPQLDLRRGEVLGLEALVRWAHPDLGLLPPLQFLPLAEEAGLMRCVTAFVLDASLAQCATWRSAGSEVSVSVNISPSNLLESDLTERVERALERYGLPPSALVLEITETSVITNLERSKAVLDQLRSLGVVVSIDDFGAGATSLTYLTNLGAGELKLDRSFISSLSDGHDARDLELVRATIELGHAMGLRVAAEGIEDEATLALLDGLGCDLAQGYFISRPMPASEISLRTVDIVPALGDLVGG